MDNLLQEKDNKKSIDKSNNGDLTRSLITENVRNRTLEQDLRIYFIPILSIIGFISILAFVTVPAVRTFFASIEEKELTSLEYEEKKIELSDLEDLSRSNELNSDLLSKLDEIVPTAKTEVVEFEKRVREIAFTSVVKIEDVVVGERVLIDKDEVNSTATADSSINGQQVARQPKLKLVQIPMNFKMEGALDNFRDMLSSIYNSGDFIVVTEMELNNSGNDTSTIDLVLSKYQYLPIKDEIEERQLLAAVPYKSEIDKGVSVFIQRKSEVQGAEKSLPIENEGESIIQDEISF